MKRRNHTMPAPDTKLAKLLQLMTSEQWDEAIRFAAKFPRLGEHQDAIKRAHEITIYPEIYIEMGYDPATEREAGIAALKERYAKPYAEALKNQREA
jgi:hypothetical protein